MVGKQESLFRHFVDVGRLDDFLTIAAQISIAEIVRDDVNDIGFIIRFSLAYGGGHKECRVHKKEEQFHAPPLALHKAAVQVSLF